MKTLNVEFWVKSVKFILKFVIRKTFEEFSKIIHWEHTRVLTVKLLYEHCRLFFFQRIRPVVCISAQGKVIKFQVGVLHSDVSPDSLWEFRAHVAVSALEALYVAAMKSQMRHHGVFVFKVTSTLGTRTRRVGSDILDFFGYFSSVVLWPGKIACKQKNSDNRTIREWKKKIFLINRKEILNNTARI